MSGTRPAVLITGAGGYLGERLTRRYLVDDAFDVVAAVRTEAAGAALAGRLGPAADRVQVVVADLADDDPLAAVDDALRNCLVRIVHGAAVTRFNVERDWLDGSTSREPPRWSPWLEPAPTSNAWSSSPPSTPPGCALG